MNTEKITRVEVIDDNGRSYVNWDSNNKVELSFQDNDRTLKIFVNNGKPPIPDDVLEEWLGGQLPEEKKSISYSQCPGECYDSFYDDNEETIDFDLDDLIRKWKETHPDTYRVTYSDKKTNTTKWECFASMNEALNNAMVMHGSGDYTIHNIVTEHPSLGQA